MPYEIKEVDGEWCVYNKDTNENKGCSPTLADAEKHMSALYAAETESADAEKAKKREDVSEADKKRAVEEYGDVKYADPVNKKYPIDTAEHIRAAWNYINQEKNAEKYSSTEVASIKKNIVSAWKKIIDKDGPPSAKKETTVEYVMNKIKEIVTVAFGRDVESEQAELPEVVEQTVDQETEQKTVSKTSDKENVLMLWKETDGTYRWFARYSNNLRDDDNPAEIIASESHRKFVEKVDRGVVPLPELWLWHRPEWMWGKATTVAYDESGFALALGYVLPGFEPVAERLAEIPSDEIKVSHGMPVKSIVRDTTDPSVIVEHETREISPLPAWAAANKWTGFSILKEDSEMTVPAEKRKALIEQWGVPADLLDTMEKANASDAQSAKEQGIESKENSEVETVVETVSETVTTTTVEPVAEVEDNREEEKQPETEETVEPVEETKAKEVEYPTRQEVADAFAAVVSPLVEGLQELKSQVESLTKEVGKLKEGDQEKVEKAIKDSPPASLAAMLSKSIIGDESTLLDGRSSLAKSKPKEEPAPKSSNGGDFISDIVGGIIAEHTHNS